MRNPKGLMRIGSTNVMTVGNFVGNVLKMESMFDNTLSTQKGILLNFINSRYNDSNWKSKDSN